MAQATSKALRDQLPPLTFDTAPAASRPALERLQGAVGMIPHLAGTMAHSPALIEGFVALRAAFAKSSLTPPEREVVALANAVANGCRYCQAIHATFAAGAGLPESEIEALRAGRDPADPRMAALARFTRAMLRERGALDEAELTRFRAAGFAPAAALDVILAAGLSTLANFAGRLLHPEPDEVLRARYR